MFWLYAECKNREMTLKCHKNAHSRKQRREMIEVSAWDFEKKEKIKRFVCIACTYYIIMFIKCTLSLTQYLLWNEVNFLIAIMNQPSARCVFQLNFIWDRFYNASKQRSLTQCVRAKLKRIAYFAIVTWFLRNSFRSLAKHNRILHPSFVRFCFSIFAFVCSGCTTPDAAHNLLHTEQCSYRIDHTSQSLRSICIEIFIMKWMQLLMLVNTF